MNDDQHLDDLERFLERGKVLEAADPPLGGAHGQKRLLLLEGGIRALAKPTAGIAEGDRVVIREVAAWLFARELGMADMVACTVLREDIPLIDGSLGRASVQLVWHLPFTADLRGNFPQAEMLKAAVLDAVIANADRGGHNWLAVDDPRNPGEHRLKLVDHGYSMDLQGALNSTFYTEQQGEAIDKDLERALRQCSEPRQRRHLESLFRDEASALTDALGRADGLASAGVV